MAEPNVLIDPFANTVADDADVANEEEDDEPGARAGDDVAYDLTDDGKGGA